MREPWREWIRSWLFLGTGQRRRLPGRAATTVGSNTPTGSACGQSGIERSLMAARRFLDRPSAIVELPARRTIRADICSSSRSHASATRSTTLRATDVDSWFASARAASPRFRHCVTLSVSVLTLAPWSVAGHDRGFSCGASVRFITNQEIHGRRARAE